MANTTEQRIATFSVSPKEFKQLRDYCEEKGLNRSEFIRRAVFKKLNEEKGNG